MLQVCFLFWVGFFAFHWIKLRTHLICQPDGKVWYSDTTLGLSLPAPLSCSAGTALTPKYGHTVTEQGWVQATPRFSYLLLKQVPRRLLIAWIAHWYSPCPCPSAMVQLTDCLNGSRAVPAGCKELSGSWPLLLSTWRQPWPPGHPQESGTGLAHSL